MKTPEEIVSFVNKCINNAEEALGLAERLNKENKVLMVIAIIQMAVIITVLALLWK